MKFTKVIASVAASAVIASTLAVGASATIAVPEEVAPGTITASDMLMFVVYSESEFRDGMTKIPATDYGFDYMDIKQVKFTYTTDDPEWFEGAFGGAVVTSCRDGQLTEEQTNALNWIQVEYWGVDDPELNIQSMDESGAKPHGVKIGDYTYEVTVDIDTEASFLPGAGYVRVGIKEWGEDMSNMVIQSLEFYAEDGSKLITFDGSGNATTYGTATDDTTTDDTTSDDATTDDTTTDDTTSDDATTDDTTTDDTTSDDTAADDDAKENTNTGVEGIAVVAGIAAIATGAAIVAKKRK